MESKPVKLEPVFANNADEACRVLERGFKEPAGHWRRAVDKALSMDPAGEWPVGYIFRQGARAVGTLLNFYSRRPGGDGAPGVVVSNHSNWYVEPEFRGFAGLQLAKLVKSEPFVFSEIFPHEHVVPLFTGLGFEVWSNGVFLVTWPQALVTARRVTSRLVALADLPANAVSDLEYKLLADHDRLGFIAAALDSGEGWRPLVFARRRVKRIPCAYLIYADSRSEVLDHRRAIASFLIRLGLPILAVEGRQTDIPGNLMFLKRRDRFYRGAFLRNRVDFAYSELVYFDVKARHDGIR